MSASSARRAPSGEGDCSSVSIGNDVLRVCAQDKVCRSSDASAHHPRDERESRAKSRAKPHGEVPEYVCILGAGVGKVECFMFDRDLSV